MNENPHEHRFPTSDDLLKFLRDQVDDIEGVSIPINPAPLQIVDSSGTPRSTMKGAGALIKLVSGRSIMIGVEDAEMLINDGVLQRLNIKCSLKDFTR